MNRVVVMGVTGCGKSTVGLLLADALNVPFADGDDLHPVANIAKMEAGTPLTDDDRWPWLADVGAWLAVHQAGGVVACSALKRSYRDAIAHAAGGEVRYIHLFASQEILEERVRARAQREGHFAGPGLLYSQFTDLEALGPDENGLACDVGAFTPQQCVEAATAFLAED